jgi:hypothetical protein
MIPRALLLVLSCLALVNCAPLSQSAKDEKDLHLATEQLRDCKHAHVTFPAGRYTAEVRSKKGTYYLAPAPLRSSGVLFGTAERGGVFVTAGGHQAAWFGDWREDADGRASTLLEAVGGSAPRLYPLSSPLIFTTTPQP